MKPPTRLIGDAEIEPELCEALIAESAREMPFDVTGGLERLEQAIESGVPAPNLDASGAASAKLKLLVAAGTVGAGVIFALAWQASRPEPVRVPEPVPAASAPVLKAPPAPPPQPAPTETAQPSPASTASHSPPPAASVPSAKQRLAEEVRHLAQTRRVAASDPASGARMADEGHARFKGGLLYQEREAVAITALARAGRQSEAAARGARFVERFPNSPFADQVRSATGLGP